MPDDLQLHKIGTGSGADEDMVATENNENHNGEGGLAQNENTNDVFSRLAT